MILNWYFFLSQHGKSQTNVHLPKWPQIFVEVISLDSWMRCRTEGYGFSPLPLNAGTYDNINVCTWRPILDGPVTEMRYWGQMLILSLLVSNSQGRNLGCSVDFGRTSSISSTQGIGWGRERLRYLTASLTNTNYKSSNRVVNSKLYSLLLYFISFS